MHPTLPGSYAIPVRTNMFISAVCSILYFVLLYRGSHADTIWETIGYGVLFALVLIPAYSLIHEAAHTMLHPNPRWNDWLGRWLCTLFVVPFTFFKHCHLRHHTKNRTDIEMWDLYLEHQQKWKRSRQPLLDDGRTWRLFPLVIRRDVRIRSFGGVLRLPATSH